MVSVLYRIQEVDGALDISSLMHWRPAHPPQSKQGTLKLTVFFDAVKTFGQGQLVSRGRRYSR